jgi:hypothetical protein
MVFQGWKEPVTLWGHRLHLRWRFDGDGLAQDYLTRCGVLVNPSCEIFRALTECMFHLSA